MKKIIRYMKKIIKIILVSIAIIAVNVIIVIIAVNWLLPAVWPSASEIGNPPPGTKEITDPDKYMKVNRYVRELMKKDPQNIFPAEIPLNAAADYYYYYTSGRGGYPGCVVYLSLSYDDYDAYCEEVDRVNALEAKDTLVIGNDGYLIFNEIHKMNGYFDDEDWDGTHDKFVIIVKNESEMRIEYLFAELRDEAVKPEELIHIVKPLYEMDYGVVAPMPTPRSSAQSTT